MADQGTEGLLSPFLRWRRIKTALPYLKGRILDVGCGSGALARHIPPTSYMGVDLDEESLLKARKRFPEHFFSSEFPEVEEGFDVVVALAVLEHVVNPSLFLKKISRYLKKDGLGSVVLTTPCPAADLIHKCGASLGLFSKHASEEHETLLDEGKIRHIAELSGLSLQVYCRFLFGMNQLVLLKLKN